MMLGEREGLIARIRQIRRTAAPRERPNTNPNDPQVDRLEALEVRVAHVEHLLEGLQDSVYRESERHAKLIVRHIHRNPIKQLLPRRRRFRFAIAEQLGHALLRGIFGILLGCGARTQKLQQAAKLAANKGIEAGGLGARVDGRGVRQRNDWRTLPLVLHPGFHTTSPYVRSNLDQNAATCNRPAG